MNKQCQKCGARFEIDQQDQEFYEKVAVPAPTLCPSCRQQRRMTFRNERRFYHRKCDLSGKQMISIYHPDSPYKVYYQDEWWSDNWDPMDYGKEFDFNRSFFEQYHELQLEVPRLNLFQKNAENSVFTNHTESLKNCYLCADVGFAEDVYYSKWIINGRDIGDCYNMEKVELCYESLYSERDFNCIYIFMSDNCRDSAFLHGCKGCSDCFMCWNLRNKKYCVFNEQKTKEEYQAFMKTVNLGSFKTFSKYKEQFLLVIKEKALHPAHNWTNCENCSGDFLYECKNVKDSFDTIYSQDCRYCYESGHSKDCYDGYEQAFDCERQYDCHACNRGKFLYFCSVCYDVSESYYSEICHNSMNLFGCVGLRRKQYCILNKQYTKAEYEEMVPRIIKHMVKTEEFGEFFPIKLSPFAYNETIAHEYFPLTEEEVLKNGWHWRDDSTEKKYKGPVYEIPDDIKDVSDDICNRILICEVTGKPYKILKAELELYRKLNVPVPRKCFDQRYKERMALRNPWKTWRRNCDRCHKSVRTSFEPDCEETVYCEQCYRSKIY